MKDSKYLSRELHEINALAVKYDAPAPLIFFIQNEMSGMSKGKVLRTKVKDILRLMGYKYKK